MTAGFGGVRNRIDGFIFYALIFTVIVAFYSHIRQGDLKAHVGFALAIADNPGYLRTFFEPGFHLLLIGIASVLQTDFYLTAPYLLAVFYLARVFVTFSIVKTELQLSEGLTRFLVFLLLIPAAVYFPWSSESFYFGIGTPNVWHSPTQLMVIPFALFITYCVVGLLHNPEGHKYKLTFLLSSLLFLSSIMKPAFAEIFIPSIGLYWLLVRNVRTSGNFIFLVLVVLPTLILLPVQFHMMANDYHLMRTGGDGVVLTWFGLIKRLYPSYPLFAFLRVLLFPILVLMMLRNKLSNYTKYCWLFVMVSYLQVAFIAQERLFDIGDFGWPYLIGLQLIFVFSLVDYVRWMKEERNVKNSKKGWLPGVAFLMHAFSGVAYFFSLLTGALVL